MRTMDPRGAANLCAFAIVNNNEGIQYEIMASVTRFVGILPLGQNFESLWQFLVGLFSFWQNFMTYYGNKNYIIGQIFNCCKWPQLTTCSSHLVALIMTDYLIFTVLEVAVLSFLLFLFDLLFSNDIKALSLLSINYLRLIHEVVEQHNTRYPSTSLCHSFPI